MAFLLYRGPEVPVMKDSQNIRCNERAKKFTSGCAVRSFFAFALLAGWFAIARDAAAGFTPPVTSPGGGDNVVVGDINLDGRDDIAVLDGRRVLVSLSDGTGAFGLAATLTGGSGSLVGFGILDFNNDGKPDVFASWQKPDGWVNVNWEGGWRSRTYATSSYLWLGHGDGTFSSPTTSTDGHGWALPPLSNPTLAYADFNCDFIADLATVDGISNVVYVTLGSYPDTHTFSAGQSPGSIAIGDFNGDGWTDLLVVNALSSNNPSLSVLLNDGNW